VTAHVPEALAASAEIALALAAPPPEGIGSPAGPGRAWPQALADGAAGIALLHAERARSGLGSWDAVHSWLSAAVADPVTAAPNAGLFLGAPALAFIVHTANGNGRYDDALTRLNEATIAVTRARLAGARKRISDGAPPAIREYDLVRGLAGLGACLLRCQPGHEVTRDVLSYLVRLTEPAIPEGEFPPWWTGVSPNGEPDPAYPEGHGNFGVSHGVSAVLALLSLAMMSDVPVPGMDEAVSRICAWTDQWRQDAGDGPWWPGFITAAQARAGIIARELRPRPSWCYGAAGAARAQQLAALALGDRHRRETAEHAMTAVLNDPVQTGRLSGTGLCHGTAGLLQAACRMAADATSPRIADAVPALARMVTSQLREPSPGPWLMDGAAGTALALCTAGTGKQPASGWDAFLLLA
jgi:hypothetical protein